MEAQWLALSPPPPQGPQQRPSCPLRTALGHWGQGDRVGAHSEWRLLSAGGWGDSWAEP